MTAFDKRVELLEKWHTRLGVNINDLADIIIDVWDASTKYSEERITNFINECYCVGTWSCPEHE